MYLQNRNRLIDLENKIVVTRGEGIGEGQTKGIGLLDKNFYK